MADPKDIYPGDRVTVDIRLTNVEVIGTDDEPTINWAPGRWLIRGGALTVVEHIPAWTPPEGWDSWEWLSVTTPSTTAIFHRNTSGDYWRCLRPEDPTDGDTILDREELLKVWGKGRWEEGEYRTKRIATLDLTGGES